MNGKLWRACALAAVGVLLGGVLSACGGDDDAAPKPKFSSSSASPTSVSSSPTAATSSAAPEESPEDFVRRWNELSTQMQNRGTTADYRAVSIGCDACLSTADLVDQYYAAGGYVRTDGWTLTSISCKSPELTRSECIAQIDNAATQYKKSAGDTERSFPAGPFAEYFKVRLINDSWNMSYIAEEAQ